jgi:hypothetical protein
MRVVFLEFHFMAFAMITCSGLVVYLRPTTIAKKPQPTSSTVGKVHGELSAGRDGEHNITFER